METIAEVQRNQREFTDRLKENFMHQLLAFRDNGGLMVKTLKSEAVRAGASGDVYNISNAVNELIREEKVTIQFIGADTYLWLKN